MWTWDNSSIDCEFRAGFSSGSPGDNACGMDDAGDCFDDYDTDTLLEMHHYSNGIFMELNGCLEEAIIEYQDAISFNPQEGYYHYNLGVALLKNGQFNEAFKELSKALKLDPDDMEAQCALADVHNELGMSLGLEGNPEEAVAEFREAIAIDPCYPEYHVNLGKALLEIGKTPDRAAGAAGMPVLVEAVTELRKALAMDPDCMEALLNLGMALTMNGSERTIDEGISMLSTVLQADPFNDEAQYCLDYAMCMKNEASRCC
jgi:tetratricopeptide (TPR) repeat protein